MGKDNLKKETANGTDTAIYEISVKKRRNIQDCKFWKPRGKKTHYCYAGQKHQNFEMPYLQNYIKKFGVRKCEANAIVTTPTVARNLVREEIEKWLGPNSKERFADKRFAVKAEYEELLDETRLRGPIEEILGDEE